MMTLEFRILGPLEVRTRSGDVLLLGRRKQRLLLAVLLLSRDQPISVDRLVDLLWHAQPPPTSASANLYTYLSNLRRMLPERITTDSGRYLLEIPTDQVDAGRFERLVDEGLHASEPAIAVERFGRALGLWHGTAALEDLTVPEPLKPATRRLAELRTRAVDALVDGRLALGEHAALVPELEVLTEQDPLYEPRWAQLMLALYRAGRQADALATFRRIRDVLRTELAIEPGPALQHLHRQILAGDPAVAAPAAAPAAAPTAAPTAAPSSASGSVAVPAQLPADLPTFTGRSADIDQLTALLTDDRTPTTAVLTGMAGIGKTALAIHVAHQIRERFPDGQLFLDLHGHTRSIDPVAPTDALSRMLRGLGVPDQQIPPDLEARSALFRTRTADRRTLVVLDNAATEAQVRPLLPGTPGCAVVITSRSVLSGLDEVSAMSLDPLSPPDASALFVKVAGESRLAAEPTGLLDDVAALCGMLPLALRIAAGRLRARPAWTLADILDRLRDEDTRLTELAWGERNVASSFGLSYEYLSTDEQWIFRLLGLHPGSDLEPCAVAALADCSVEDAEQRLEGLLDANLLTQRTPGRYVLHDLLRTHAADTARQTDPPAEHRAAIGGLLDHYVATAANAMDQLYPAERSDRPGVMPPGPPMLPLAGDGAARRWLDGELTNLLAAARHAADNGWPECAVQLAQILAPHLRTRYDHDRALPLHEQARRCAVALQDRSAEFAALRALGDLHRTLAKYQEAGQYYREAITLADQLADDAAVSAVLYGLGNLERLAGRAHSAITHHEEALKLARYAGKRSAEAQILNSLGVDHLASGDHELAERYHGEALAVATETGDRRQECLTLGSLARVYQTVGRIDEAMAHDQRALDLAREIGDRRRELRAIMGIAEIHLATGRRTAALETFQTTLALARELGDTMHEVEAQIRTGEAYDDLGEHDQAVEYQQTALDIAYRIDVPNLQFEALISLCKSLRGQRQLADSLAHGTKALQLAREIGQRHDEARALSALADTQAALGDRDPARDNWQQALTIFSKLGAPEQALVVEQLRRLAAE